MASTFAPLQSSGIPWALSEQAIPRVQDLTGQMVGEMNRNRQHAQELALKQQSEDRNFEIMQRKMDLEQQLRDAEQQKWGVQAEYYKNQAGLIKEHTVTSAQARLDKSKAELARNFVMTESNKFKTEDFISGKAQQYLSDATSKRFSGVAQDAGLSAIKDVETVRVSSSVLKGIERAENERRLTEAKKLEYDLKRKAEEDKRNFEENQNEKKFAQKHSEFKEKTINTWATDELGRLTTLEGKVMAMKAPSPEDEAKQKKLLDDIEAKRNAVYQKRDTQLRVLAGIESPEQATDSRLFMRGTEGYQPDQKSMFPLVIGEPAKTDRKPDTSVSGAPPAPNEPGKEPDKQDKEPEPYNGDGFY